MQFVYDLKNKMLLWAIVCCDQLRIMAFWLISLRPYHGMLISCYYIYSYSANSNKISQIMSFWRLMKLNCTFFKCASLSLMVRTFQSGPSGPIRPMVSAMRFIYNVQKMTHKGIHSWLRTTSLGIKTGNTWFSSIYIAMKLIWIPNTTRLLW